LADFGRCSKYSMILSGQAGILHSKEGQATVSDNKNQFWLISSRYHVEFCAIVQAIKMELPLGEGEQKMFCTVRRHLST